MPRDDSGSEPHAMGEVKVTAETAKALLCVPVKGGQYWIPKSVVHDDSEVYKYGDKGKPKLQITREKYDKEKNDWIFAKLGRMTYEEFSAVARAAKEGFAEVNAPQGSKPEGWK